MRLFLLGAGPLPLENRKIANAGGLRSEQFLKGIVESSFEGEIFLATVENDNYPKEQRQIKLQNNNIHIHFCSYGKQHTSFQQNLKKDLLEFQPDVAIGVNTFPSSVMAKIISDDIPFWADNNGWILSELQAQAFGMGKNVYIHHGMQIEKKILERADKISVVSTPQKFVTIGELGIMGRLTKENFGEKIVAVIPNACLPAEELEKREQERGKTITREHERTKESDSRNLSKNIHNKESSSIHSPSIPSADSKWETKKFRGKKFPQDAFAILWIGGFNAWADEKTLFDSLEIVMAKVSNFHFLMTGEDLMGIDETQYPSFKNRVEKSKFSDRYHLLGWIDGKDVPHLLRECDAGINVDRMCIETQTGARNRLNEFLRYDVPIITTEGTEIANILKNTSAGIVVKSGDAQEISREILQIAKEEKIGEALKKNGKKLKENKFSAIIAMKPLLEWLEDPKRVPKAHQQKFSLVSSGISYLKQRGFRAFFQKCRQVIKEKIG